MIFEGINRRHYVNNNSSEENPRNDGETDENCSYTMQKIIRISDDDDGGDCWERMVKGGEEMRA